jgi:hypothetical protein
MENKLYLKIKEWREWCDNDEDVMNDHIRDFFSDRLDKSELFFILDKFNPQIK